MLPLAVTTERVPENILERGCLVKMVRIERTCLFNSTMRNGSRSKASCPEDEPLIGLSVQDWLDEAGYEIRLTQSALEALHELESAADVLSALVTDIRLGGEEDGWQIARRARELNPLLPIVYMSGASAIDQSSQGVPHSIMVQKPFAAAQIITAISTLMNKVSPTAPIS